MSPGSPYLEEDKEDKKEEEVKVYFATWMEDN
jgi:hypothetical protein